MATDEISNLLKAGIEAAKNKNREEARRLFEEVLEKDDSNEMAWLWMATVVDTPREQRICLENVLEINPNNERAKEMLKRLKPSPITDQSALKPQSGTRASALKSAAPKPAAAPPRPAAPARPAAKKPASAQRAPQRPGQRRVSRNTYIIGGIVAFLLIGTGVYLLLNSGTGAPTPPTPTIGTPGANATSNSTQVAKAPTLPPPGRIITLNPNAVTELPTFTPSPTLIPPPTKSPTPTPIPLASYGLLYIGEGRGRANPSIYSATGDGKNEKLLISADQSATDLAISPNGKQIAYATTATDGSGQIAVANVDGSGSNIVTKLKDKTAGSPAWSADGKQIAFYSDQSGTNQIYTMSSDGGNVTQITSNKVGARDPAYSPDGKQLAYSADAGHGSLQIFVIATGAKDDSAATQLTDTQGDNTQAQYAPNGSYIVFTSTRDHRHDVYRMEPDGADNELLTYDDNGAENITPAWTPDSAFILFASDRTGGVMNLYIMALDGSNVQQITKATGKTYGGRFRPGK